jgi:putative oxidoreductase
MSKWLNKFQPCGALVLRIVLGLTMLHYGYQKVVPHGALNREAHYIASLGLPAWLGYVSAFTEFAGSILIILGLFTRLAAGFIAINMLFAFFLVGIHSSFSSYSNILALAAIAIMLLFYGAGTLSIDRKIGFA